MVKSAKAWIKIFPSTESLPKFNFSIYIIYQKPGPVNKNKNSTAENAVLSFPDLL
jgi:hypothetical protein